MGKIESIAENLFFPEGPRWNQRDSKLYFSDVLSSKVSRINESLPNGVEGLRGHGRSEQVYLFSLLILHKSWARVRFLESNLGSKWRELGRAQGSR